MTFKKDIEKNLNKLLIETLKSKGIEVQPDTYFWINSEHLINDSIEKVDVVIDGNINIPKEWLKEGDQKEYDNIVGLIRERK